MKRLPPFLLFVALALPVFPAAVRAETAAVDAMNAVRREFPWLLINEADLAISTGPALSQSIPAVEIFFSTPLAFPVTAETWADAVEPAADLGPLFVLSDTLLGKSQAVDPADIAWEPPDPVPPSARTAIKHLVAAISLAQPFINRAVASVPPEARAHFAEMYEWTGDKPPLSDDISSRRIHKRFEDMKPYLDGDMRTAGGLVLMAVDDALEGLRDTIYYVPAPVRFQSPVGDIVIGGNGPDVYTKKDMQDAVILVDFGGRNTYIGPVGFANPGETRVVIDLGDNIEVRSDGKTPGAAGASLFGVAVMAMPNDLGVKKLETGPWSQGASLGGVAACIVSGKVESTAGRFAQGAAVYGVGLFNASLAAESSYTATGYAQGVGGPRAVGIFRHQGDNAKLTGGVTTPDPREAGGAESLCQGVGFGRRAYAGGGIGICTLVGDGLSALSSYFAQGAGYWHAAGVFRLRGNHGTVQGRRYALGAGIHSAFGHFEAFGNSNRFLNWGVGPAYGWDRGVGTAVIVGDALEVQADWGIGTASIGGRAFAYYKGTSNKYKLPDFGSGGFLRNEAAYSVQLIDGVGTQIQGFGDLGDIGDARAMRNSWGVFHVSSGTFVPDLFLAPPVWPAVERAAAQTEQAVDLRAELTAAGAAPRKDAVASLVDVAAAFSLDHETPREALRQLLSLPAAEAPFLVDALDPAAIEQTIQLTIAISARGGALAKNLFAVKAPQRALLCTNLLRLSRPTAAIPLLLTRANGKDSDLTAAALRALGGLMSSDTGEEPGARVILDSVSQALVKGASSERALARLARLRFPDAIALLAVCADLSASDRVEFLNAAPEDVTAQLGAPGAGKFMDIVGRSAAANRARAQKELAAIDKVKPAVRRLAEKKSNSPHRATAKAALIAAGQLGKGDARNAAWVEKFLTHPRGDMREAAAVALGRLGEAGLPALRRASRASTPRVRALAALGAGFAVSPHAKSVLETALSDSSPLVAMAAAAVIHTLPEALQSALPDLKKKAARRLNETTSRDLKFQLRTLP